MTTTLTEPAPSISHRFAPVHRGRGYHRVGGAVVASGKRNGTEHKLLVGLERVAVATVTYRASQAPFEAQGGGGARVLSALRAVADHADLTGRAELSVKVPWPRDSGTDVDTAAAWAAVTAFCEATDTPATTDLRRAVVDALGGTTSLPGQEGAGIFDTRTGSFSPIYDDAPRFGVLLWHQPGSSTAEVTGVGTLPSDDMPSDLTEAGAWSRTTTETRSASSVSWSPRWLTTTRQSSASSAGTARSRPWASCSTRTRTSPRTLCGCGCGSLPQLVSVSRHPDVRHLGSQLHAREDANRPHLLRWGRCVLVTRAGPEPVAAGLRCAAGNANGPHPDGVRPVPTMKRWVPGQ